MWHSLKVFLFLPPLLLALDFLWLGVFAGGLYKKDLGSLMRLTESGGMDPILWPALIVYLAIPAGIVLFVLPRVAGAGPYLVQALSWGALFGVIVYAIYDMTNYSLVRGWSLRITLLDICWGAVLNGIGSLCAAWLDRWLQ